ncbi:N-acetyl-alpha-D-glucosaminyl L-malate synthase BshA [Desulforamulus ruminis]|uniref:N-acetyl-alpha-D-glucosaminyl L-malate synthase BshA n=1 Tax=Desulforamulus ruminis TaxID=1564 RepID=UPI002354919A|nr:N-acetyl-alpha-D-glucosaminyl L-malate synthase BshA [Desulforamulus ruminis]
MKIGILCHSTYGGSGVVAAELGKKLAQRGHQIHFVTVGRPFRLPSYQPNVFVHEVDAFHHPLFEVPPYFLSQVGKTVEVARCYGLDLLHAHYAMPHAIGAHLAREILGRELPVITTLHGTDTSLVGAHAGFYEITRHGLEKSDVVTVVSNFLAQQTRDTFHFQGSLPVVYNFVDLEVFKPRQDSIRSTLAGQNEALLVHVSNFRPLKRVLDVIETFHLVRQKRPARLVLVGDGPDMPLAQSKAIELGLIGDIVFLGRQDAVAPVIAASDVMLLPSCCESFGLAALEALACGVPVVATASCGIPEVVEKDRVGFLTAVGDVPAMARYTLKLLEDKALHQTMSTRAREYAVTRFNADHWVEKYEEIYQSVMG